VRYSPFGAAALVAPMLVRVWLDVHRVPRGVNGGEDGRCSLLITSGGHGDGEQIQAPCRQVSVADLQPAVSPQQRGRSPVPQAVAPRGRVGHGPQGTGLPSASGAGKPVPWGVRQLLA